MGLRKEVDASGVRIHGQTAFGSDRERSALGVDAKAGTASALFLVDSDGTEWAFWAHGSVLRFGTRAEWVTLTGGAAV